MPFYRHRPALGPLTTPPTPSPHSPHTTRPSTQPHAPGHTGYAVVDLETTGLSPTTHAIIEIGIVLTDASGAVERQWSSLIRPASTDGTIDVGPTEIHGLHATDLTDAPSLPEVADLLVADLAGRVIVAHNARFDVGFLTQALTRTGHLRPGLRVPRVCTMEWARHFLTTSSRSLTSCCAAAGITLEQHHSALDDAGAAAALLRQYLTTSRRRSEEPPWSLTLDDAAAFTGWTWDAAAARTQRTRLRPRHT